MTTLSPDKKLVLKQQAIEKELHQTIVKKREENLKKEIEETEHARYKRQSIRKLKDCGIILAYEYLLDQLCTHGLPNKDDAFEFAALSCLKFERKLKSQKAAELAERNRRRSMGEEAWQKEQEEKRKAEEAAKRKAKKGKSPKKGAKKKGKKA